MEKKKIYSMIYDSKEYGNNGKGEYLGEFEKVKQLREDVYMDDFIGINTETKEVCVVLSREICGQGGGTHYELIKLDIINKNIAMRIILIIRFAFLMMKELIQKVGELLRKIQLEDFILEKMEDRFQRKLVKEKQNKQLTDFAAAIRAEVREKAKQEDAPLYSGDGIDHLVCLSEVEKSIDKCLKKLER